MAFTEKLNPSLIHSLLEAASYYINPETETFDLMSEEVAAALAKAEEPYFLDTEQAAYAFQALFESQTIDLWLTWLAGEIANLSHGQISLTEADRELVWKTIGGIKGPSKSRLLTRNTDNSRWVVTFGPYLDSVTVTHI